MLKIVNLAAAHHAICHTHWSCSQKTSLQIRSFADTVQSIVKVIPMIAERLRKIA